MVQDVVDVHVLFDIPDLIRLWIAWIMQEIMILLRDVFFVNLKAEQPMLNIVLGKI